LNVPSLVNATTGAIAGQLRKSLTAKFAKKSAKDSKKAAWRGRNSRKEKGAFDELNAPENLTLLLQRHTAVRLFPVSAM
jgi:hypothetical protein